MKLRKEQKYIKELLTILAEAQQNAKREGVTYQVCRVEGNLLALPANDEMDAWSDVLVEISA